MIAFKKQGNFNLRFMCFASICCLPQFVTYCEWAYTVCLIADSAMACVSDVIPIQNVKRNRVISGTFVKMFRYMNKKVVNLHT